MTTTTTAAATTQGDLDGAWFADLLGAERARIVGSLAELDAERLGVVSSSGADREEDPDDGGGEGSTRAAELARVETLRERLEDRLEDRLEEVDAALGRIARGTYGTCRSCGGPIGEARLEAMPEVTECVACKRAPVWARRGLR